MSKKRNYKLPDEFVFTISDYSSFEQIWKGCLSKRSLILWSICVILFFFVSCFCIVFFTPINKLVPSSKDYKLEKMMIDQSETIDNLSDSITNLSQYLTSLRVVVFGDTSYQERKDTTLITSKLKVDSISFEYDDQEKEFVTQMEQKEMYGLLHRTGSDHLNTEFTFYVPVRGHLNPKVNSTHGSFGVDISCEKDAMIHAILSGTVTVLEYTLGSGYTIGIQHTNGYMSLYKNTTDPLKRKGSKVVAGDPIAIVGESLDKQIGYNLHFELWRQGESLDPMQYINFDK